MLHEFIGRDIRLPQDAAKSAGREACMQQDRTSKASRIGVLAQNDMAAALAHTAKAHAFQGGNSLLT